MVEFTTKHFNIFSKKIQTIQNPTEKYIFAAFIIQMCKENNPKFREDLFRKKAGIE